MAQLIFAFLLQHANHVLEHTKSVQKGDWAQSLDFSYMVAPQTELAGKTIGFVGFGNVAQKTADIARGVRHAGDCQLPHDERTGKPKKF